MLLELEPYKTHIFVSISKKRHISIMERTFFFSDSHYVQFTCNFSENRGAIEEELRLQDPVSMVMSSIFTL